VVPVERYDAVVDQLAEDLLDIVNLESGRPLVRAIERGTDLYPRSTPWLADLYVQWDHTAQCNDVYSPKIGRLRIPYHHVRTGDHKPHGLLLARGPSFVDQAPLTRMPVTGIAPTIAALLDTELTDVDGRVPDGLLRAPSSA
jgi:predicted AlkP superfamily phosphohydrolase/phosphomutase